MIPTKGQNTAKYKAINGLLITEQSKMPQINFRRSLSNCSAEKQLKTFLIGPKISCIKFDYLTRMRSVPLKLFES